MKKSFKILDELSKAEVHLGNPCEKTPHSISDLECDPRVYFNGKASLAGPSRARTCDHLIMSQVSNSFNGPSSNHNVNICKIKGYELSASIPAIAQAMYGIYRTAKYDSESSPSSYT